MIRFVQRWLEDQGYAPAPIENHMVMEREPVVAQHLVMPMPESVGWWGFGSVTTSCKPSLTE